MAVDYCDKEPPEAGTLGDQVATGNNDDLQGLWGGMPLSECSGVCTERKQHTQPFKVSAQVLVRELERFYGSSKSIANLLELQIQTQDLIVIVVEFNVN